MRHYLFCLVCIFFLTSQSLYAGIHINTSKTNADIIDIVQLSISEHDELVVDIQFKLDKSINEGLVIIFRFETDLPEPIDTLEVIHLQSWQEDSNARYYTYSDTITSGEIGSIHYYLAYDYDEEDIGASPNSDLHGTILITDPFFDNCSNSVQITWDKYTLQSFPSLVPKATDFTHYHIFIDGNPIDIIPYESSSETQSYIYELPAPGVYTFRVKAVEFADPQNPGKYSFSNTISKPFFFPELRSLELTHLSVDGIEGVMAAASTEGDHTDFEFALERSPNANAWDEVIRLEANSGGEINFFDDEANLEEGPWYYRVSAYLVDDARGPCQEVAYTSDSLATIFLELLELRMDELSLDLDLGIEHPVQTAESTYQIEYMLSGEPEFSPYGDLFAFLETRIERISLNILPFSGDITFRVALSDGSGVFSNLVVVSIEPEVRIPNAFRPSSHIPENRVFQPEFIGFSPNDYVMSIYDRHGLLLFTTNDPATAWDGQLQHGGAVGTGSVLSDGAYMYHVRFTLPSGESAERKGVVYLVR